MDLEISTREVNEEQNSVTLSPSVPQEASHETCYCSSEVGSENSFLVNIVLVYFNFI